MSPRVADWAELVRLPAALTVPGDTLVGAAGTPGLGVRRGALPVASVCLYWAGMALNDVADRHVDAVERPERPIPSGRVRPGQAVAAATGLTAAGVGVAAVAGGRRAALVAGALAGVVWAYDLLLKDGPAGPAAMAAARGLDVALGATAAGAGVAAWSAPATLLAGHTAAVTLLSRGEVHGTSPGTARIVVATTATAAAATALRGRRSPLAVALAVAYAATVARAQAAAVARPEATTVRRATGAGIRGMIPLQAALAARSSPRLALGLLAAGPVARAASKVVSPT